MLYGLHVSGAIQVSGVPFEGLWSVSFDADWDV